MFSLVISLRAQKRIELVADFIFREWGLKAHQKFISELERCLKIIEANPKSFRRNVAMPEVHECIVTPYNILYYIVEGQQVLILSMEDTRMLPINVSSLLK